MNLGYKQKALIMIGKSNGYIKVSDAKRIYPGKLDRMATLHNLCLLGFFKEERDEMQNPIWRYIPENKREGEKNGNNHEDK